MFKFISLLSWHIDTAFAQSILSTSKNTASKTQSELQNIFSSLKSAVGNWVAAFVVFFFFFLLAKVVKQTVINRISVKLDEEHQDVIDLVGRLTYFGIVALGATVSLKLVGIDVITIMAAMGLGIGFALKDLILNFMAGVIILISRQFTIGDYILINGIIGKVENIQLRCTILQALDGSRIIVPNSDLFSKQVISFTTNPFRRVDIQVGVEYSSNLTKVIEIAQKIMQSDPDLVTEPGPTIICDQFADSSINFILRFWLDSKKNWLQIKSKIMVNIKKTFDEEGIVIAFPSRSIYFANEPQDGNPSFSKKKKTIGKQAEINASQEELLAEAIDPSSGQTEGSDKVKNPSSSTSTETTSEEGTKKNNTQNKNPDETPPDTGANFLAQMNTN